MADISDLIAHAVDKSPVEFANTFDSIMRDRIGDAVAAKKVGLAQSLYSSSEE